MSSPCRLYLVTPPRIDDLDVFAKAFAAALGAGDVACAQLRLKQQNGKAAPDETILRAADKLLPIAQQHDVTFVINDRPDLALKAGADGVHVGQSDTPYRQARAILGEDASIGVTCHNSKHFALEAGEAGADYVAFGAFFPSQTKVPQFTAEPSLIEWWRYATTVPCVAIGGVTPENCGPLVRAGADFLAVSSAIWDGAEGPALSVVRFERAIGDA